MILLQNAASTCWYALSNLLPADPLHACIFIILTWMFHIYICSAVAMFCILVGTLACKFSQLNDQLNDLKYNDVDLGIFSLRHSLICQVVWELQLYFQNIMLLSISCIFTGAINGCSNAYFYFSRQIDYTYAILQMVEVAAAFVVLDAICYASERLKNKVLLFFLPLATKSLQLYTFSLIIG